MDEQRQNGDMVLPPHTYCHILDGTKGSVACYVGPTEKSLGGNDRPVVFDENSKRFKKVPLEYAIQDFKTAPEGFYVTLKNPTKNQLEGSGDLNEKSDINVGRKVNLPGPCSFPLYPGQMAKIVKGHHLKSNQYLVARVYDEQSARNNMKSAIISTNPENSEGKDTPVNIDLTMGKLMIIKGSDVSFFIPPTGVEVLSDSHHNHIQDAVTLERLEYCILLDENGKKRYVQGPEVVFPEPTEKFIVDKKDKNLRKYRAKELSEISGIYIKVTTDYTDEITKVEHKAGEELFITGKDTPLYYPREEHAIIKYDGKSIHFATAIPSGEARYLMHRMKGEIDLVKGPATLLPDPRTHVLVRRVLDESQTVNWFPGNVRALEYNRGLRVMLDGSDDFVTNASYVSSAGLTNNTGAMIPGSYTSKSVLRSTSRTLAGDNFERKDNHTQPRTVTLNTKYDGAVTIDIWTGYAINVVKKAGERRTVVGPKTVMLEYDEYLETTQLSTGMPKNDSHSKVTAYLRVANNRVSDIVEVESKDLCKLNVALAYSVNFEDDPKKWFDVENYVSFLTVHLRSVIKNCVKTHTIEEFYSDSINIIRTLILKSAEEGGKRPGYTFPENGMRICDVEIIDVKIEDEQIKHMIVDSQNQSVAQMLNLRQEERRLEMTNKEHSIAREIDDIEEKTAKLKHGYNIADSERHHQIKANKDLLALTHSFNVYTQEIELQESINELQKAKLARTKEEQEQILEFDKAKQGIALEKLKSEVDAFTARYSAIDDKFIAAIEASGNKELLETVSKSMAPAALLGGESVVDVLKGLVKGTVLEKSLVKLSPGDGE